MDLNENKTEEKKTPKTTAEKLSDLDKQIEKFKARKRVLLARDRKEERKARNHRLIQIGAEVEAICGEITDLEALKGFLSQYGHVLRKLQQPKKEEPNSLDYLKDPSLDDLY